MGNGVARCLIDKGFAVHGYDVRPEALDQLRSDGGIAFSSSAEAATGADLAVLLVLNADQVEDAVFGSDGLTRALQPGTVIVSATTMSASRARDLANRTSEAGFG